MDCTSFRGSVVSAADIFGKPIFPERSVAEKLCSCCSIFFLSS